MAAAWLIVEVFHVPLGVSHCTSILSRALKGLGSLQTGRVRGWSIVLEKSRARQGGRCPDSPVHSLEPSVPEKAVSTLGDVPGGSAELGQAEFEDTLKSL